MIPSRSRVFTIPNLVSLARILLVGLLWWLILSGEPGWAAWLMVLMATTDWLDGWLARRLDQVTDLGAILDPVGDGLMMASAVLGGMIRSWVPLLVGGLLLMRSLLVTSCSAWVGVRTRNQIAVRWSGKVAITFLYVAIPGFYFSSAAAGAVRDGLAAIAWIAALVGLVFYWWSGARYVRDGFALIRREGLESS